MITISTGNLTASYRKSLGFFDKKKATKRLLNRDAALYSSSAALKALIANRLGWVDVASRMQTEVPLLESIRDEFTQAGFVDIVLLGMGGSSLCPETQARLFGMRKPFRALHVLDSTDPSALIRVQRAIDLSRTLFIVASKSGGTLETRSQADYFADQLQKRNVADWGKQFIAITDEGSTLEQTARASGYRRVFLNPSDIGGRFSSLSYFGLVPALFLDIDLKKWLGRAVAMQEQIDARTGEANPAIALAGLMTSAWGSKRDKLTFVASKKTAPIVPWIEQLVAESTGKKGIGIIPIEAEPTGTLADYGTDRLLFFLRDKKETPNKNLQQGLMRKKSAWGECVLGDKYDVAAQFLLWEAAIALTGLGMKINPFDEPNVAESKANTQALLGEFEQRGALPWPSKPSTKKSQLLATTASTNAKNTSPTPEEAVANLVMAGKAPEYFSVLSYFDQSAVYQRELPKLRAAIRKKSGCAVLAGTGPRFLHSIGQLYKGGPQSGRFLVIVRESYELLEIPGKKFDFGTLIRAQAIGDARALMKRKRPVVVLATSAPEQLLKSLTKAILAAKKSGSTLSKPKPKPKASAKSAAKKSKRPVVSKNSRTASR